MNWMHRVRIIMIMFGGIIVCMGVADCRRADAVSQDWQHFEEVVFEVADDLVESALRENATSAEISSYQASINNLETYLSDLHRQKQSPSPDTYEAFRYLIDTLRRVASHPAGSSASPEFQRDVATLRQALHNSKMSRHEMSQTASQTSQSISQPSEVEMGFSVFYRPEGKGDFQEIAEGASLHSGDHYKIRFTASQNVYLYIFQMDVSSIYGLFPLQEFRGVPVNLKNPILAGQEYYIPAQDKSFMLDERTGKEQIFFVVLPQPDPNLEQLYHEVVAAQNGGVQDAISASQTALLKSLNARKGVASVVQDASSEQSKVSFQGDGGENFSILQQYLTGDCQNQDCVYTLTFNHE